MLLNFTFENEAKRANLQGKKRISNRWISLYMLSSAFLPEFTSETLNFLSCSS